MYLLYLDDSGSAANASEEYLILGGIAVHENQIRWFNQELDQIAFSINPSSPESVEFHASVIFSGKTDPWKNYTDKNARIGIIKSALRVIERAFPSARLFACAIHKSSFKQQDPMKLAFEDIISRFHMFLGRQKYSGDPHMGQILLDKSAHETSLQELARTFRNNGTRWNTQTFNIPDVPVFCDSRASRLIQYADLVAYSVFRRYNASDTSYFDLISGRFDEDKGIIHGLSHKHTNQTKCLCPACLSRRTNQEIP